MRRFVTVFCWLDPGEPPPLDGDTRRLAIASTAVVVVIGTTHLLPLAAQPWFGLCAALLIAAIAILRNQTGTGLITLLAILFLSEYQPNSVQQVFARFDLGTVWAAQLGSRLVVADVIFVLAMLLSIRLA